MKRLCVWKVWLYCSGHRKAWDWSAFQNEVWQEGVGGSSTLCSIPVLNLHAETLSLAPHIGIVTFSTSISNLKLAKLGQLIVCEIGMYPWITKRGKISKSKSSQGAHYIGSRRQRKEMENRHHVTRLSITGRAKVGLWLFK